MAVDDKARPAPHLALVEMLVAAADEMGHLREGLRTRTIVGQAQGIVMERLDLDAEKALEYL
ncbi:MAG TPA: ANTAR domain-containing protein, partial [Nocardioides sp.]|nr:ANTAR domain-containing protein [Nocardioides sp.]